MILAIVLFCTNSFAVVVGTYNLKQLESKEKLKQDFLKTQFVDIWALQEVSVEKVEKSEEKLQSLFSDKKLNHIYFYPVNFENKKYEGQAIVSRFEIHNVEIIELEKTSKKRRVALAVSFKDLPFLLINTDHEVDAFTLGFDDRKKQLKCLAEFLKKYLGPVVLLGDFNTVGEPWIWNNKEEILKTEDFLKKAHLKRVVSGESDSTTFNKPPFLKSEIDLIFTRGVPAYPWEKLKNREGSDHYPIYTDVIIKE